MAKEGREGKRNKREKEENSRGESSSSGSSGSNGGSGRRAVADPTTSYRGSGEFDRESGLNQTLENGQMIPRNHFANEDEWAEYFATVPQEIKRAHREKARSNQERVYSGLADGMSLADLGVTDEKDHGRSLYRRLTSYGLLDPNFEYNWESGTKRDVGTSDLTARSRSSAITDSERREHAEQQRWGGDFAGRIRSDAGNRMNRAVNEGVFTRGENGLLYNDPDNDASRRQFYDDRGYFIDPNTRQRTGGGHSGHVYGGGGGMGGGSAVFGGVSSGAWGANNPTGTPATPAKPANPYYRPPTNPWGTPGVTQQNSPMAPQVAMPQTQNASPMTAQSSFFGEPEAQASASPWRRRRTFGAPL